MTDHPILFRAALAEAQQGEPWTDCVETMKALFKRHGETYKGHPEFNNRFTEVVGRAAYMQDSVEDQDSGPVGGGGDRVSDGCFRFDGEDGPHDIQPTHWMPPTSPTGEKPTSNLSKRRSTGIFS